jgi:hypothetical protein
MLVVTLVFTPCSVHVVLKEIWYTSRENPKNHYLNFRKNFRGKFYRQIEEVVFQIRVG